MYGANHLAHLLRAASVGRDDALFAEVADSGARVSHGDFWLGAERNAAVLVEAGVEAGDRVAVQVEKSMQALQLYLGTILAGGVFLPLNTAYTKAEISYFLGDSEPAVFVCDPGKLQDLRPAAKRAGTGSVLTLGADGSGTLAGAAADAVPLAEAAARQADDLAAILYTSGTTGRSKGAMMTHRNLGSNAAVLADYWRFSADDVLIHALPIFHTHGLFVATNVLLVSGGGMIFHPRFDAEAIVADLPRATALMGVPTFYVRLLDQPGLTQEATAKMRLFISGSAPLLDETHVHWQGRTGHDILERYGMTETGMNTSNPCDGDRRAGTVGFPLPQVDLLVTDPQSGKPLPTGETGAIEVRGPNVFKGYWRMPEKTAEEVRENGFFITGDLGFLDERGYLTLVGRSKDLIISGGYNVYPKEIESRIDDIEGVVESAVIGLPHLEFGEGVAAVVVSQSGSDLTEEKVAERLKADLARYKQPKRIWFVDELPRNAMGKVQKNLLRDAYKDAFTGERGSA